MTQQSYDRLIRCHDFIAAFALFCEAKKKLTADDLALLKMAMDLADYGGLGEEVSPAGL